MMNKVVLVMQLSLSVLSADSRHVLFECQRNNIFILFRYLFLIGLSV